MTLRIQGRAVDGGPGFGAGNETKIPAAPAPSLALCMIVRDEAENLAAAIQSAREAMVVDEVIVCDTGSTDNTVAIARAAGATVVHFPWADDFALARNHALKQCTADWVLVLDADERLVAPIASPLLRPRLAGQQAIYTLDIENDIGTKGAITHRMPRLFPRVPSVRWHGTIHENPVDEAGEMPLLHLPGYVIAHHGYRPEVVKAKGKGARNSRLLLDSIAKDPHNAQKRLYLAQVFHQAEDYPQAIEQARMALYLARIDTLDVTMFEQAAVDTITCLSKLGHYEQAAHEAQMLLRVHPIAHPAFWVTLGNTYNALDAFALGAAAFQSAIAYRETVTAQCDQGVLTWMPHAGMGLALAHMDRPQEALLCLERALAMGCGDQQPAIQVAFDQVSAACQPPHAATCPALGPVETEKRTTP